MPLQHNDGLDGVDGLGPVPPPGEDTFHDHLVIQTQLQDDPGEIADQSPGQAPFTSIEVVYTL